MRITESKLRRIIRSVINENSPHDNSDEFVPPGSYGNSERQMTLEEMEKIFKYYLENRHTDGNKLDGDDEVIELQKKHVDYLEKIKAFINDLIEEKGKSYGQSPTASR
jgi:hypothetical protein